MSLKEDAFILKTFLKIDKKKMGNVFKSFSWSAIANVSRVVFQFLGMIILGRILSPTEYGIIGIMSIFIAIGDMLIDSGMNGAILHKKNVCAIDYSTLFVYNLCISIVLYLIFMCISPFVSSYYGISELTSYINVFCLTLIAYAFGLSANSKLCREMNFKSIAKINILSSFISLVIAVILAYVGFGVWALIIQTLLTTLLSTAGSLIVSKIGISFKFSVDSFKQQFGFGIWLMFASFVDTICNNIYSNIIPKIASVQYNGLYSQAYRLSNVPSNTIISTISQVLFPLLCRSESKSNAYQRYATIINYFSCFIFSFIAIYSDLIIRILLGEKWIDAVPFLRILSISSIFLIMQNLQRNLLKSVRATKEVFILQLFKAAIKVVVIIVSLLFHNVYLLVLGILLSNIINTIISYPAIKKCAEISYRIQIFGFARVLASVLSLLIFARISFSILNLSHFESLFFFPFGLVLYILVSYLTKDPAQIYSYSFAKHMILRRIKHQNQ